MICGEICLIIFRYYVHNVHKAFCNDFSSSERLIFSNIYTQYLIAPNISYSNILKRLRWENRFTHLRKCDDILCGIVIVFKM